jgi:hypothetical protein
MYLCTVSVHDDDKFDNVVVRLPAEPLLASGALVTMVTAVTAIC